MLADFFIPWEKKDLDWEIFQSTGGGAWPGPPGAHDLVETNAGRVYSKPGERVQLCSKW